jgi:hypothetical protein
MKIRCSSLGDLMTNGRGAETLGKTAEKVIRDRWIKETYGRERYFSSKAIQKGLQCEEDSLSLYTRVSGDLLIKNEENLQNDWITGTPDAFGEDYVLDIKTSFDIFTFMEADFKALYEWQLRGYMMLTGKPRAILAYCLVDMPTEMSERELMYIDNEDDYDRVSKLCIYGDIDEASRIKTFEINRDFEIEKKIIERIELARIFAKDLILNK